MKAFNLSKDSWHFYIANFGKKRIWVEDGSDICEYTRAVFGGMFLFLLAGLAICLGIAWVAVSLYNIYDIMFNGAEFLPTTVMLLGLIGAGGLLVGVAVVVDWYHNLPDKPEPEPGFVKLAYRKFKNKTCFRLDFN